MKYLARRSEVESSVVEKLIEELSVGRELATLLAMRGIKDSDSAMHFLNPDISDLTPVMEYSGMAEAVARIKQAIEYDESIVIYGDYDCDGVCATAILYSYFKQNGAQINYYIPNRKKEGYGINREALEDIAERFYSDLIITVDCGITAKEDIEYATDVLGIDVIVTDHHEAPQELPECIVIDAKVQRKDNTFNELCGAGVALRLCEAFGGQEAMAAYLDLAAIATIGDIVPLVGDNRIIVDYGLKIINARARQSVKLLLENAGIAVDATVTSTDIAFKIVPRINAIGRLSDSNKAVEMFVEVDYFYIKSLVEQASEFNKERQQYTDDLVQDVLAKLEDYDLQNNRAIVLYDVRWEAGVLGIACSRLVEIFRRPVILFTMSDGVYKGSARSISGVNLYESLKAVKSFMKTFGGHSMACGLVVEEANIEGFVFALNEYMRIFDEQLFLPKYEYDIELGLQNFSLELMDEIARLEPFGTDNPMPSFLVNDLSTPFTQIGSTKHIKNYVNDRLEFVYFGEYSNINKYNTCQNKAVIAECCNKYFANRKYTQALIKDIVIEEFKDIEEDYLDAKYLYQAKYEDDSVFKVEYIDETQALELLKNSIYGVCFLAYTKQTFLRYKELLGERLIFTQLNTLPNENPYNSLVLDINMKQKLNYYDKIVFLDEPIKLGVIDFLLLKMNAKVYMMKGGKDRSIANVGNKFPSYEEMRDIYKDLKRIIEQGNYRNITEVHNAYALKGNIDTIKFYIAFYVFFELKIIKLSDKLYIDKTVKTSLENSEIYTKIREVVQK